MVSLKIERSLLKAGERVCVAVSGGADSVALLVALAELRAELGIGLMAVHVNHGLRGAESDADQAFVRELCERLEVPMTLFKVDTPARQAAEREGVEEAARTLRYTAFGGLLKHGAADVVATAHTLDDQAETVMMKLLRGAWTEGLGAISPVVQEQPTANSQQRTESAGRIVRPTLRVRRREIEAFLRERGQDWREDATNADISLIRNRVRHELMPMLRSFNPAADEMLANVAELARDEQAYWEAEVGQLLPRLLLPGKPVRGGGRAVGTAAGEAAVALELERLRGLGAAMRRRVVRGAVRSLGCRLSFEETAKLLALAGFGGYEGVTGRVGSKLELRGGLRAERSARELRLSRVG